MLSALAADPIPWAERLAIMCQLGSKEATAREVLDAAAKAGFQRIQINFEWDRVDGAFLKHLPVWISAAGLQCETLGAYVNCLLPSANLMHTREQDFDLAIGMAPAFGARHLIAWTGSHTLDLMKPHPGNATRGSEDAIVRFLEPRLKRLESASLRLALETYITLACPDGRRWPGY